MKSFSVSIQIKLLQQFIYTGLSVFRILQKKLKFSGCLFFFRPLQRMCAGMLLAAFSFMMAAFVQIAIQVSNEGI